MIWIFCSLLPGLVAANAIDRITPQVASLALSPDADRELFDLMLVVGESDGEMMLAPWKEYKPRCVKHVMKTTSSIDKKYSEEQIEAAFLRECDSARQNPESRESGFKSHEACRLFARKLAKARAEEVKTGNTEQYEEFCRDYYHHQKHDPEVPHGSKWRPEDGHVTPRQPREELPAHDHACAAFSSWCTPFLMLLGVLSLSA